MRFLPSTCALLLAGTGLAAAGFGGLEEAADSDMASDDLVLEEQVESPSVQTRVVYQFHGQRVRMDSTWKFGVAVLLADARTRQLRFTSLDDTKVTLVSAATQRNRMKQVEGATLDLAKIPKPKATGNVERIGDWQAEVFETEIAGNTVRLWVAKDVPQVPNDIL